MPGVNLPNNQIGYYLMTLLVCGILHEVGHALAAVRYVLLHHIQCSKLCHHRPGTLLTLSKAWYFIYEIRLLQTSVKKLVCLHCVSGILQEVCFLLAGLNLIFKGGAE